jgi:hypothetical protein
MGQDAQQRGTTGRGERLCQAHELGAYRTVRDVERALEQCCDDYSRRSSGAIQREWSVLPSAPWGWV